MHLRSTRFFALGFCVLSGVANAAESEKSPAAEPGAASAPASDSLPREPVGAESPILKSTPPVKPAPRPVLDHFPKSTGATSSRISAAIKAGLPSYTPPPPDEISADGAIILPQFEVQGDKIRVPPEKEALTKAGKMQQLSKRHPGASPMELRDYLRLEQMNELNDIADTLKAVGRNAESTELRKEIQRTFIRHPSWQEEDMDKAYNRGRR